MDVGLPVPLPAPWLSRGSALLRTRRRWIAAALLGLAVACGLRAVRPAAPPTVRLWAAARDLPGGSPLRAADLAAEAVPTGEVPGGALRVGSPVVGRLLAAPVRRGEPLTDVRLLSPTLLSAVASPGDVAVPVRVSDGVAVTTVVQAGDVVDVLAAGLDAASGDPTPPAVVASGVRVLAVPPPAASDDAAGLLVVAATPQQATLLADAAGRARLSVAVERPS